MKRILILALICGLSGLLTIACERGVRAGREGETETYQPRPAPIEERASRLVAQQMKGELMRVDQKNQTVTIRAENGMEQTFKVDHGIRIRDLQGKEGSEVVASWMDEAGAKTAMNIKVTELVTKPKSKAKSPASR